MKNKSLCFATYFRTSILSFALSLKHQLTETHFYRQSTHVLQLYLKQDDNDRRFYDRFHDVMNLGNIKANSNSKY